MAKQFSKLLRHAGIITSEQSHLNWMFKDEKLDSYLLLHWISENVTTENVLSPTEQRQYSELVNNDAICVEQECRGKFDEMCEEYSDDYEDEEDIEEQIRLLQQHTEELDSVYKQFCDGECPLEDLREQHIATIVKQDLAADRCQETAQQLQEQETLLLQELHKMQMFYDRFQSGPLFLSQMPLEKLTWYTKLFQSFYNIYVDRQFQQHTGKLDISTMMKQCKQLHHGLRTNMLQESITKCKLAGTTAVLDMMSMNNRKVLSVLDLELDMAYKQAAVESLESEELLIEEQVLPEALEQLVMLQIKRIVLHENEQKLTRRNDRYEKLQGLSNNLCEILEHYELLWNIYKGELQRACDMQLVQTECYKITTVACADTSSRVDLMQCLITGNSLTGDIKHEHMKSAAVVLHRNISSRKTEIETRSFVTDIEVSFNLLSEMNSLCKIIYSGITQDVTAQPVFTSATSYTLANVKRTLTNLKDKLEIEKKNFADKKVKTGSPLTKAQRSLWIYFVTDPKRVIDLIAKVRKQLDGSRSNQTKLQKMGINM